MNELRKFKAYNHVSEGIELSANPNNPGGTTGKFKANAGQTSSFALDIQYTQRYVKGSGTLQVTFVELDGLTQVWRFTLPQADATFSQNFSVGNSILVQHEDFWWTVYGVVRFVNDSVMEIGLSAPAQGAGWGENWFNGIVAFRNLSPLAWYEIKYNLTGTTSTYANGFDGGIMAWEGELAQNQTIDAELKSGNVENWYQNQYQGKAFQTPPRNDSQVSSKFFDAPCLFNINMGGFPIIVPNWREELGENYDENTSPDEFKGENDLNLIIEIKAWRSASKNHEPIVFNYSIESDTGWYAENGNGGITDIVTSQPSYTNVDKGVPQISLDRVATSKIEFSFARDVDAFAASNYITATLLKRVDFERYNQSRLNHGLTYLSSTVRAECNNIAANLDVLGKGELTDLKGQIVGSGQGIAVSFFYTPNASSIAEIEIGDEYILSVGVYDENNDILCEYVLDANQYSQNTDEDNLIELNDARMYDPDADVADGLAAGYTDISLWNEDGIAFLYSMKQTELNFGEILSIDGKLVSIKNDAMDGTTNYDDENNFIVIQSFPIPFEKVATLPSGLPIYEGIESRDFNLKPTDPFKALSVETIEGAGFNDVNIFGSLKINWQYWNELNGVPDAFLNRSDAFNGFNQRTSNYSEKPENATAGDEFNTRLALFVTCQNRETDSQTVYSFEMPMIVYDYGEDVHTRNGVAPDDFADFTGEIFTEKLDGTDLNGIVLSTEDTKMKVHFINNGRVSGAQPFWFMNRFEVAEQIGFDIWEISNLQTPASNNPLQPLQNETALAVYPDGSGGWWTECIIDSTKVSDDQGYKLSGRMGFNEDGGGIGFGYSVGFTIGFNS